MQLDLTDLSFILKFDAPTWEAEAKGLPSNLNLKVRSEDPLTALTALIEHIKDLRQPDKFPVISSKDWEHSLVESKTTRNEIARQIMIRTREALKDPEQVRRLAIDAYFKVADKEIQTSGDFFAQGFEQGVALALDR